MRQKTCRVCKIKFQPQKPMQPVCGIKCAIEDAKAIKKKDVRKADRKRKEEIKSKSELMKEAQFEFNRYIRLRDKDKPCISCQRFHKGQMHAGHYISTGAATELRFNEDNCHAQCAPCNNHLSGNPIKYRINLIEKIGIERVERLEGPHPMPNWTKDDIRAIKAKYRKLLKLSNLK